MDNNLDFAHFILQKKDYFKSHYRKFIVNGVLHM